MSAAPVDISVVIPTFNRLWCLPEAVQSCRGNECAVEIVVVDDGSSDGTWAWLREQKDVVALRQFNQGKGWAVARALAAARGRFIKFLDSDDALVPGALDTQLRVANETGADLVVAGARVVDDRGRILRECDYQQTDDIIAQQLGEGDGSHYSAFLFKRWITDRTPHRQEMGPLDDRMFMIEVSLLHPRVAVVRGPVLIHRQHARERLQSAAGLKHVVKTYQLLEAYRLAVSALEENGELTPRRAAAVTRVLWPLAHWIARTHPEEACEVVSWIYALHPEFEVPERGALGLCFRRIGFRGTERLLRWRRRMLALTRGAGPPAALNLSRRGVGGVTAGSQPPVARGTGVLTVLPQGDSP